MNAYLLENASGIYSDSSVDELGAMGWGAHRNTEPTKIKGRRMFEMGERETELC